MTRWLGLFTVWALLVAATLLSYALGTGANGLALRRITGVAVVVIALAKAWLIGMRYMELNHAARPLRMLYVGWILVVGATLLTMFWLA